MLAFLLGKRPLSKGLSLLVLGRMLVPVVSTTSSNSLQVDNPTTLPTPCDAVAEDLVKTSKTFRT